MGIFIRFLSFISEQFQSSSSKKERNKINIIVDHQVRQIRGKIEQYIRAMEVVWDSNSQMSRITDFTDKNIPHPPPSIQDPTHFLYIIAMNKTSLFSDEELKNLLFLLSRCQQLFLETQHFEEKGSFFSSWIAQNLKDDLQNVYQELWEFKEKFSSSDDRSSRNDNIQR